MINWCLVNTDGPKNYGISQPTNYIPHSYLNSSVLHTEYHPCCLERLTYLIPSKKRTLLLKHPLFRQINQSSNNWIARTQMVRSGIVKWTHCLSPDDKLLSTVTVPSWELGRWQFPRSTSIFCSPKSRSMQGRSCWKPPPITRGKNPGDRWTQTSSQQSCHFLPTDHLS